MAISQGTVKLTKRVVDAAAPRDKAFILFDAQIAGFGLRVQPSGIKAFILEYRPSAMRGANKRRITLGRYGPMTADQARKAALDALARIRQGQDPAAEKARERSAQPLGELIDRFLVEHVEAKRKAGTLRVTRGILLRNVKPSLGALPAERVTRPAVARLHSAMHATPVQANRTLEAISALFGWLGKTGHVAEGFNPARGVERYPERPRERFLSGEEIGRLGAALREAEGRFDVWSVAAIKLLLLTGARLREVLDARWEHLDVARGCLFLQDSKTGARPLYLNCAALAILDALPRVAGNPHIIPGREGGPRSDLKRPWVAVCKLAGLEGLRLHDLRHSFASIGAGASLGLPILGKLLGHSQPSTTHRYAHLASDPMRAAAEAIGAARALCRERRSSLAEQVQKVHLDF
jgi:integrase